MPPFTVERTVAELIDVWAGELQTVRDLCADLTDEQWNSPTPCPGWTVGDVVAHLTDIEQTMTGAARPDHEPDWTMLPHASSDFGRLTEVGVDYRRTHPQPAVLAELADVVAQRRVQLEALPEGADVMGLFGSPTTVDRLLRIRIFDSWAHEQDIRSAVGLYGGWSSTAAAVSQEQIVASLPYVWARRAGAPEGATAQIDITDPVLPRSVYVVSLADRRGRETEQCPDPDVRVRLTWPDLMGLACGRVDATDPALASRIELSGDEDLGAALLAAMIITP